MNQKDLIKYALIAIGAYLIYEYIQKNGGISGLVMISLLFGLICRRLVRACRCAGNFVPIGIFLASGNVSLPSSGISSRFLSSDAITDFDSAINITAHCLARIAELVNGGLSPIREVLA